MGFLERAIKNGISNGISNALGDAVKQAVEPKATAFANKLATEFDQAEVSNTLVEEKVEVEIDADVLAKWAEKLPEYPVWNCGGKYYELEEGDNWVKFSAYFDTEAEGENSVPAYRELLRANGFREAGQYPDKDHLYKKVGGICYHVDMEHCFEGSMNSPDIWFNNEEPDGGFDYVKV